MSAARDTIEAIAVAERCSEAVDRGFGQLAIAAIAARSPGPARAFEAAAWVQRAAEIGLDYIATIIQPGMTDDERDALVELQVALAEAA